MTKARAVLSAFLAIGFVSATIAVLWYISSELPPGQRGSLLGALLFMACPTLIVGGAVLSISRTRAMPSVSSGKFMSGFGWVLLLVTGCAVISAPVLDGGFAGTAGFISSIFLFLAGFPGAMMVALVGVRQWQERRSGVVLTLTPGTRRFSGVTIATTGLAMLLVAGGTAWYCGDWGKVRSRASASMALLVLCDIGLPGLLLILIGCWRVKRRG